MNVDYEKAIRQLDVTARGSRKFLRQHMSTHLADVYRHLRDGRTAKAEESFWEFSMAAKGLGWKGGGERLPRPFNHKHLERLYWQASNLLGKGGQPQRHASAYDGQDYSSLHLLSKLGKKRRKPSFLGSQRD